MGTPLKVIFVGDSDNDTAMALELQRGGYDPEFKHVYTLEALKADLDGETWDVLIAENVSELCEGLEICKVLHEKGFDLPLILMSGEFSVGQVVEAVKAGAHDCVTWGNLARIVPAVKRGLHEATVRRERKRLEQEIVRENAFRRTIVDCIPAGLMVFDSDRRLKLVNRVFCRMVGWSAEEILGAMPPYDFLPPDDTGRNGEAFFRRGVSGHLHTGATVVELQRRDGEPFNSLLLISSLEDSLGKILGTVALVCDFTGNGRLDEETARLERLYLAGQMATAMAHAIRNPICSARGFLELAGLREEGDGSWYRHYSSAAIKELDRANAMIREFLSLARDKPVNKAAQNLNSLVEKVLPSLKRAAAVSSVEVKTDLQRIPDLLLDGEEVCQLILNLAHNGLEAMSSGGRLTIRTYLEGKEVVLAVEDIGAGIKNNVLEQLGTPFFTTKEVGLGLGLPACYCIAYRHDATITVDTGPGGTTFYVRFVL